MLITPKSYSRTRLRSILSYKSIDTEYEFDSSDEIELFLPVDMRYGKVLNFKVNSNSTIENKFQVLAVGINPLTIKQLTTNTILWYEDVKYGQLFDTDIEAFTVNTQFVRPNSLKPYFHVSNLEGLYMYCKSNEFITNMSISMVYEDLDNMK